jgi:tetratricopeptide (TPR) repeat protein
MFVPCKCPQCGGDLQIPDDRDIVKCMYCSTDIKVREVISVNIGNVDNYLKLGSAAFEAGNFRESIEYLNKALEIDPASAKAWVDKGLAFGWLSNLSSDNFEQMLSYIDKGISCSKNDDEATVYKMLVAPQMLLLAKAYEDMSRKHTMEFISVTQTIYDHIDRCKRIILMLEKGLEYDEQFQEIKTYIVRLATHEFKNHRATTDEKEFFKQKVLQYDESGLSAESLKKAESSNCFVVTATMGNEDNIFVDNLRMFRDDVMSSSKLGRRTVRWYYKYGPHIAHIIRNSVLLRLISFVFVVLPATIAVYPKIAKIRGLKHQRNKSISNYD